MKKLSCPVCEVIVGYGEFSAGAWFEAKCEGRTCGAFFHLGKAEDEMYFSEVRCPHCNRMKLWGSFPPGSKFYDIRCRRCGEYFDFDSFRAERGVFVQRDRGAVHLQDLGPAPELRGGAVQESRQ